MAQANAPRRRTWAVTAVGLLLLFQAIVLAGLSPLLLAIELSRLPASAFAPLIGEDGFQDSDLDRLLTLPESTLESLAEEFDLERIENVAISTVFMPLSVLALVAAFGFLGLWRHAWTLASMLQGLTLLIALLLYLDSRPWYIYILMLYSIVMVLYLHDGDVRHPFRTQPVATDQPDAAIPARCPGGER
jgi:hypothetical protein